MDSKLEDILGGKGKDAPGSSSGSEAGAGAGAGKDAGAGAGAGAGQAQKSPEELKKEEHLANLDRAIAEGNAELTRIRTAKKEEGGGTGNGGAAGEEIPAINRKDPNSQAWLGEIDKTVKPVTDAMEKEKQEVRGFALRKFLADKPALAADAEKLKQLIKVYEPLATVQGISERTQEGVLSVLEMAYGALNRDEVLRRAREQGVSEAEAAAALASVATDSGAGTYVPPTGTQARRRKLTEEEKQIAIKWYGSEENYFKAQEAAQKSQS